MRVRTKARGLVIAAALCLPLPAAAADRPVTVDDLSSLRDVRDPQLSPDGQWVAYVVAFDDVKKDKGDSDVWMVSWDGKEQVRLTSTPGKERAPRWSPDGKYLAFVASRNDDENDKDEDAPKKGPQVWLLNRAGGEAQQLTDLKGGVSDYAWSPDGKRLVLAVDDPDPADEPEKMEGWKRKTKPPIVIDRYHFKEDSSGYLGKLRTHLYLFDVESRKAEPLTSGTSDEESPAWSPDGSLIAFVSNRTADPDRNTDTNIYVIEAKTGATPRQLTTFNGPDSGDPAFSPDGKWVAYLQGDETKYYAYSLNKLAIVPTGGGAARVLTGALDRAVSDPHWTKDGAGILVRVEDDRSEYLARVAIADGKLEPLTSGRRVISGFTGIPSGRVAVLSSTPKEPGEVQALEDGQLRRLTKQNDDWLKDRQLSVTDDVTFKAKDGTVVNGLLSKPSGGASGPYPLVLYIHGGPNGQDDHSFSFERELFTQNGYAVLEVNYRGSSGRGSAYQKAIYADWGNKEVMDLLAGVDYAVSSGVADPERLVLGGWSYGGILTNYAIASDPRFKAAVSGASSSLQTSMYGLDQYIVQYDSEMGQPWKTPDVWMKVSYPFFHADRIRTPTLFLCGDKDFNVPIAGVEQMYQALTSLKIPAELVIYPGQHHGLALPSYRRDRLQRYLAWWGSHLKSAGPGATK
jgi:dipeptidyl aminopeptidase/acylaminoacyl peptidase